MGQEFEYDVFLSHNAADKPRLRRLAERLRTAGLRVWFDEWIIQPGDDICLAIERGVESARKLLPGLPREALCSDSAGFRVRHRAFPGTARPTSGREPSLVS
jgi:hypothetical protein